jgi:DNA-binding NarL/FixJ family response regulator
MHARHTNVRPTALPAVDERQDRFGVAVPGADLNSMTLNAIRNLTSRQREVLTVMLQGKSNKGICRALNLAEPTVKNHVTAILKTLEVTSRTEAVIKVVRANVFATSYRSPPNTYLGYIPLPEPMTFR